MVDMFMAVVLLWAQPYPPAGNEVQTDGVRCYHLGGQVASAPVDGVCYVDVYLKSLGDVGAVDFVARGFNATNESLDSNVARICTCSVVEGAPPAGHDSDGVCLSYVWVDEVLCADTGGVCLDRSEFVSCVCSYTLSAECLNVG